MNLQQINLDSLHQRFFENPRVTRITKFIQKFPADESSPELEDLLRNHSEEPIEDDDEIDSRDALDCLLGYYSLLEIASLIGYIPNQLPKEITEPALQILNQPDVKRYYQRHYRQLLPELFCHRLQGHSQLFENTHSEEATAIFMQFLMQASMLESDHNVSMFLWFLDDGIHNGCDWSDLLAPLENPKLFFKIILKPDRSQKTLSVSLKGLLRFVQACRDLDTLLSRAQNSPLLQSAMWHHYNYWFNHLKDKIAKELKDALQEFRRWEGFSDKRELYRQEISHSLADVDVAMQSLLDGHYGKALNEVARCTSLKRNVNITEWSNNNKACVSVWFYLRETGQIKTNFKNSENVTMGECRFWNDHSPDATEAYARSWAEWYITCITTKGGAIYQPGYNWIKSVNELVATMTVKENTVSALASTADCTVKISVFDDYALSGS